MAADPLHIFIVSDGTGATGAALVKAGLVLFRGQRAFSEDVVMTRFPNTRSLGMLERVLERASQERAFVVHTFGSDQLREQVEKGAKSRGVPTADVIGPLIQSFAKFLHMRPESKSGILHQVDEDYFRRIDAVEFAVMHDDSKATAGLPFADVVLVGISRTGKTPLAVYLALEGWRVANVALVPGQDLPKEIEQVDPRRIVGLVIEPDRLAEIRTSRLRHLGQARTDYDDLERIGEEIRWSRQLFRQRGWPVIDTTAKSIEESANAVLDRVIGADRRLKEL